MEPHRTAPAALRLLPVGTALGLALCLAACGANPEKLAQKIEQGDAAGALKTLERARSKATKPTEIAALSLLEAHARLQLCAQRQCPTTPGPALPSLLQPVAALLQQAPLPVTLGKGKDQFTLTSTSVVASATTAFAKLPNQPTALLALRQALPPERAQTQLEALVLPALNAARAGAPEEAGNMLRAIDSASGITEGYRYTAGWLAAMLAADEALLQSRSAALRAQSTAPEPASAALLRMLPHALLAQNGTVPQALAILARWFEPLTPRTFGPLALPNAPAMVAQELATLGANPPAHWQAAWPAGQGPLGLALQRTSLAINPNQPAVWQAYLPALVEAVAKGEPIPELMLDDRSVAIAKGVSGPSRPQLGKALLTAARQLQNRPSTAAPLLHLASLLNLDSPQQAELDKLAQSLIIKAAEAKDITATLALAQARPAAAANNRQIVAPLLVEDIKSSLRTGQFERAVSTSTLIETQLNLPVEFGPLVLEEFNAELARTHKLEELNANDPHWLTMPQDAAALDLGPLWGFMSEYFAARPEILRGQLTTLIGNAKGPWGPPSAMYRVLHAFPAADQPAQQAWLYNAIPAAALEDLSLSAPKLATLSGQLLATHAGLTITPLLEAALARAHTLEETREVWAATPANVRPLLRQLRPQFAALMKGLEAYDQHDDDTAAQALGTLTEGQWLQMAEPALEGLTEKLAPLAGLYVPLSAAPEIPLAALWVEPLGLKGGALNTLQLTFLNRLGTQASTDPRTLVSTPATRTRLTLTGPFRFNSRTLALTAPVLASSPGGASLPTLFGPISQIQFKPSGPSTLVILKLAGGNTVQLARVMGNPAEILRPDGQYTILTALEQTLTPAITGGQGILPPGSLLTLQTAPTTQPASTLFGFTGEVYPLLGTLQHPAGNRPISFSGEYDAATLTSGFTFSYPLAQSGQPVKAGVLCQSLAGALHCGAHHLHSPKVAFAALSRGQQTQESLASAVEERAAHTISASTELLAQARTARLARVAAAPQSTPVQSGLTLGPSGTLPSASPAISGTLAPTTPTLPTPKATPANPPSASAPVEAPQAKAPEQPAPGVFIYRGDSPQPEPTPAPSATTPPPAAEPAAGPLAEPAAAEEE